MSQLATMPSFPEINSESTFQLLLSSLFRGTSNTSNASNEEKTIHDNLENKTLTFHVCGVRDRKTRLNNNTISTDNGKVNARSMITTIHYSLKENKEENTVGALKAQIAQELNIPNGCEMKLFYGGYELEKNSELLSLYVLEQDRNILLDPHIVVALKEGKIMNTNTVELCEKIEEKKRRSDLHTTTTISIIAVDTNHHNY